jgi:bla regulator protein blaR1
VEKKAMHEHIARTLYYFEVHLLYSSVVGFAAWVLTSIRRGSATTKYWIWVATSLNFILPVGAVLDKFLASHLAWAAPLGVIGDAANRISRSPAASVVWLVGTIFMLTRLCLRIRAERRDAHVGVDPTALRPKPGFLAQGVPVRFTEGQEAPAVGGLLRPHISLPSEIDRLLSEDELNAVLIHEVTHARRRDNLIRLVYEVGLCGLWFHPLVWIAGSRLALYRELSCDESVVQSARGGALLSALAKLANPDRGFLLQATASSFLGDRLARLASAQPQRTCRSASGLLIALFSATLLGGIFETVAHTACCFIAKR